MNVQQLRRLVERATDQAEGGEHGERLREAAQRAAELAHKALRGMGLKSRWYSGYWNSTVDIPLPGVEAYLTLQLAGQYFPKGGYNFVVTMWAPLGGEGIGWEEFEAAADAIAGHKSLMGQFGKAKVTREKKVIRLWTDIPDDKVEHAIEKVAEVVKKIARACAQSFEKVASDKRSDTDVLRSGFLEYRERSADEVAELVEAIVRRGRE